MRGPSSERGGNLSTGQGRLLARQDTIDMQAAVQASVRSPVLRGRP